jgi:hypothetical protein
MQLLPGRERDPDRRDDDETGEFPRLRKRAQAVAECV